ncbi:MAG: cytochrome c oxidase assembly protein, partial [Acidimicrobiales bacterium]
MWDLLVRHWGLGPIGYVLIAVAIVHQVGYVRRQRAVADRTKDSYRLRRWRAASFLGGLAAVFVALQSPIDYWSDYLFWVHMIEHLLLIVVAAPLIVLGAPWLVLLRGLPVGWRRGVSRVGLRVGRTGPVAALGRAVNRPVVAWLIFVIDFWAWHMPGPYDATLRYPVLHYTEHITFLAFAILFWLQVIDSQPLRSRLSYPGRIAFLAAGAVQNWILAMALAFASGPWYAGYVHLAHRPGGITALDDQTIGAGIMWIPGMLPMALAVVLLALRMTRREEADDLDEALAELIASERAKAGAEEPDGRDAGGWPRDGRDAGVW